MFLELKNIKQNIEDDREILELINKKHRIKNDVIKSYRILKKSVDARKKNDINIVYNILIETDNLVSLEKLVDNREVFKYQKTELNELPFGGKILNKRPIIIGSGPAGLFAGLILAERGFCPIILERGMDIESRSIEVKNFFYSGIFNKESNIQFGEGGAGTFSDGKLTTRIKDERCQYILERFVEFGAPIEILYDNKPHIGTDILRHVISNMRKKIIELGGDVRFLSKVTDIKIQNDRVCGVIVNGEYKIETDIVIAALGHSARDTYSMIYSLGVDMISKPFSIGVRIEHKQSMIDESQYGKYAGHKKLGAADYRLAYTSKNTGRSVYSFCMCPGGMVVAASSEEDMVVTNGMSEYKRDRDNANSAIVVSITPEDFESNHPLSGIEFQRKWEKLAFIHGGSKYLAPCQLVGDFLIGKPSTGIRSIVPSYMPGVNMTSLENCLPSYVTETLKEGLIDFDKKISGFACLDALLTGVETRTSAPLRIVRNQNMESVSLKNFYPIGEGAGYAGGIVSAGVDGIKVAQMIIRQYKPR